MNRVAQAIVEEKTRIIDIDLRAYFDNVQHSLLLEKVARRVRDDAVLHLLKMILQATGKKGVPQGGVMTPRTQKITSSLTGGWGSDGNWVRIDACRMWLYVYDIWHAPAILRRPSASIARAIYCCVSSNSPMRSNSWPRTAPFHRVKPIATSNKLSD